MVAAWLTELLLDQINRDLLAAAGQHTPEYLQHVEQLRWVHLARVGGSAAYVQPRARLCGFHNCVHVKLLFLGVAGFLRPCASHASGRAGSRICVTCVCTCVCGQSVTATRRADAPCTPPLLQVLLDAVCACAELEHHHGPAGELRAVGGAGGVCGGQGGPGGTAGVPDEEP